MASTKNTRTNDTVNNDAFAEAMAKLEGEKEVMKEARIGNRRQASFKKLTTNIAANQKRMVELMASLETTTDPAQRKELYDAALKLKLRLADQNRRLEKYGERDA